MSEWVKLNADDGHVLNAYVSRPKSEPVGALVLIQEIFGVNGHIRRVADAFAGDGFLVAVPALFDRYEQGVELKYEGEDAKHAYELMGKLRPETALLDIAAAYGLAKQSGKGIGVVGFCFGGLMSWMTATRGETLKMQPSCCVGYYPGGIGKFAAEEPSCPVMLHFGAKDTHIGKDQVEAVRSAHPEVEIYVYENAGHGFNCDARVDFYPPAATLARERTLTFLKTHIA
ncbi:MAG TPA: dienelactone hydrolase family protein [Edaphobacter sp.]